MAKPTISIPDGMLEDVDRRAAEAGMSRSAFIHEAIARYGEAGYERYLAEYFEPVGRAVIDAWRFERDSGPAADFNAVVQHVFEW